MKKIKIFHALDHLDTYELNRFEKYVKSPYFNANQGLINIVEAYNRRRKKGNTDFLSKKEIWSVSFGNKAYNDGRLRKALSDLLKLYEDFLCQELLEEKPIQRATLLMEAVEKRKLEALYKSSMRRADQLTADNTDASAQLHYHRFQTEKFFYELTDFDIKRTEKSNLPNIVNSLDYFYLAEKLKYYCTGLSRSAFIDHKYNYLFIREIEQHIKENKYEDIPIVNIWINIYFLQTEEIEDVEKYFQNYKKAFRTIVHQVPQKEASQIFTYGQNYCIRSINQGQDAYFMELFELYQEAINSRIYLEGGTLDPVVFRNIVTVALRLKEYEWTDGFIKDYGGFINESFRLNAVAYSKGALNFYLGKYDEVLTNLNEMEVLDISYELNTKSLLIMNYFEMQNIDVLDSLLDSFYVYLNRHKNITQYRREGYINLISFTRRLMNTLPSDKKTHEKMLSKLSKTKTIVSGAWLKEKILERLT